MPKPLPIRETREIEHLCGVGGYLEFSWSPGNYTPTAGELVDVQEWLIDHAYENHELAMSGGRGSMQRRRVIDDFRFVTIANMDLSKARANPERLPGPANMETTQPFYDGRLEGTGSDKFQISMEFHCGDPTFWTHPELQSIARPEQTSRGVFYFCESIMLDRVTILNSARGTDVPGAVVNFRIEGHGSTPLQRFVDAVWCGAGALNWDRKKQGMDKDA